jgi:large subunit ribosomal protein L19e
MNLSSQRKMAASLLKVGIGRVWLDEEHIEKISSAVTKDDIRKLIQEGKIKVKPIKGTSRYRARLRKNQKKKGRRKGHGKRKGKKGARTPQKKKWISTIRPIRSVLKELRDTGKLSTSDYRKLYALAKGGTFKSKAHLNAYIKEKGLLNGKRT